MMKKIFYMNEKPTDYMIYADGRIYSLKSNKFLKFRTSKNKNNDYDYVTLYDDGSDYQISVHRMVAITFIPNPENKPEVNHKDGNKHNNDISNLEWVSKSENVIHAFKHGLKHGKSGSKSHFAIPYIISYLMPVINEISFKVNKPSCIYIQASFTLSSE